MGRTYAGVLGFVAFAAEVARGAVHASAPEATLGRACLGLLAFAAVGAVVGWLADGIVEQSVYDRVSAELAAHEKASAAEGATA